MAKTKKRITKSQVKETETERVKDCKCPNCCLPAIRIDRKIICEHCDTIFIERKEHEVHVSRIGVTQEMIKPKKRKGGGWPWF